MTRAFAPPRIGRLKACLVPIASHVLAVILQAFLSLEAMAQAPALPLPLCTDEQMRIPDWDQDPSPNMPFDQPVLRYPAGAKREHWGLSIQLRVEADGRVTCLHPDDIDQDPVEWTSQRVDALQRFASARFAPFVRDGVPSAVRIYIWLREQETPPPSPPAPRVPLAQLRIVMERTSCLGNCPIYTVEIDGDGQVTYEGEAYVAVQGIRRYRIPRGRVADLSRRMAESDVWSARDDYHAIDDIPGFRLELTRGAQTRSIQGSGGAARGMPEAIDRFVAAVDDAVGARRWRTLSMDTLRALGEQSFAFDSEAGSRLLVCGLDDGEAEEAAILRLLELGASPTRKAEGCGMDLTPRPPLDAALAAGRDRLVQELLERGALRADELSQDRVDELFRLALVGGRLASVQLAWNAAAPLRPSLTYLRPSWTEGAPAAPEPVLFKLERDPARASRWQAADIVEWLAAQGVDVGVRDLDGKSLLHIAASSADLELVLSLIRLGADPAIRSKAGRLPLDWAESDSVSVALLEAMPAVALQGDLLEGIQAKAAERYWPRTLEWIERR